MIITLVAVGKLKTPGIRATCDEYAKRIRTRQKLAIIEVPNAGRRAPAAAEASTWEARAIARAIPAANRVFCLSRSGRPDSSAAWARRLQDWRESGRDVSLLIGGAFGLEPSLIAEAEASLSLSPLTLPHEMARAVLLEQLYRADTILHGEPYHKAT